MAENTIPYVTAYGNITRALQKIQAAATPDRFTQDFLATKLGLSGGSAKPVIPFLKRTGFLGSDGTPTQLYKRFRNSGQRGAAAAEALRKGFGPLYEINEYAHEVRDDNALKGIIVQASGMDESSSTVRAIIGSFRALAAFADFEAAVDGEPEDEVVRAETSGDQPTVPAEGIPSGINFGYTINLHLPSTSDVAVFNAIFKSLREHLLR